MSIKNPKILIVSLVLAVLSGCITTEYNVGTRKEDIMFYSSEKEVAMGRNISDYIKEEYEISQNPYYVERVSEIGQRLAGVCDRQAINYYFYAIEDKEGKEEKNAFSVPGGYIYIFESLLNDLNDDELAYVLAHEIGHVVSRHSIKRLQAAMGYNFLIIASGYADADPGFQRGLAFALAQIIMGFSREDEFNADELAVKYTQLAGFDPKAGVEVLEKFYEESKKEIRPISYFKTHPYPAQRIRNLKETLRMPLDVDDYLSF